VGSLKQLYRAAHRGALEALARLGLNAARTKDYYSPLPVRRELEKNVARWNRPSALTGVAYDVTAMKELLGQLVAEYGPELAALPSYDEAKALGYGPGFTRVDAQLTFWMMRHLKPRRYLEIGSGLSTYYAWQGAERNRAEGHACRLGCIDPYASAKVRGLPGLEVDERPVQEVEPSLFEELEAGDILFIDSTHVVKVDGDVPFLYLEAVPRVQPGVWIHSHDIHFPYNVPHPAEAYILRAKWPMMWTEAMLLQAFLSHNRAYQLELAAPLLRHFEPTFLAATLPDFRPTMVEDYDTHFGSVWYRRNQI
jgi:hypothetical protein